VSLLIKEYPDIMIRVPEKKCDNTWRASGYSKYIDRLIRKLNLTKNITFLGPLSAEEMAGELASAQVFAYASYGDNSPNSLAEAMLVGAPVVTSLAGGIPSMVQDGETALCFPSGDEIVMAECIRMFFEDPEMANRIGNQARIIARKRHDPERIAKTTLDIYRRVGGLVPSK
jgi:glycosyltransferase involved in cell wall biosynthesis